MTWPKNKQPMKTLLFLILFISGLGGFAKAQIVTTRSGFVNTLWQADKKLIVDDLMEFDDKEADHFWPVYDKYMKKWGKLMNYRIYRMEVYNDEFKSMSPMALSKYMNELFVNDVELTQLQKKTYKRVRKTLSPMRANQFMQIEYAFQLVFLNEMQQRASFISDLMKKL
jgi:hypothetical protein